MTDAEIDVDYGDEEETRIVPEGTADERPVLYTDYLAKSTPVHVKVEHDKAPESERVWLWESPPPSLGMGGAKLAEVLAGNPDASHEARLKAS